MNEKKQQSSIMKKWTTRETEIVNTKYFKCHAGNKGED